MLRSYAPALVFLALGGGLGLVFAVINSKLGPQRTRRREVRADPYECGLPSDYRRGMRFGISFYLVAIMFIIFDVEVILLIPTALALSDFGLHALLAMGFFFLMLGIAFVYDWRRGVLDWKE
jgi:NADH-quinone oxidoreductase subunit A